MNQAKMGQQVLICFLDLFVRAVPAVHWSVLKVLFMKLRKCRWLLQTGPNQSGSQLTLSSKLVCFFIF